MLSFRTIQQRIEEEVLRLRFKESPEELFEPIAYILALGGKRIRPALTLASCHVYTDNIDGAILPALSLEVFHNFTLLHDDLMDKADIRRGKPTVHKAWSDNTAILSGDAMLIIAYQLLSRAETNQLKVLVDLFSQTALSICAGQQYDMNFESRLDVVESEYLEMIRLKTAVLLACALKMGAIMGGASSQESAYLYDYGIHLGLAFQLQDDLLDVYGDPCVFGKKIGGDIVCNKKTFLLINALSKADREQKQVLLQWMGQTVFDPEEKISAFKAIYSNLGLKELTEQKIEQCYEKALSYLSRLGVSEDRLAILKEVNELLLHRQL